MVEDLDEATFDVLAHHVFPATRLGVHVLPVQADDVDQQPLGEPVLTVWLTVGPLCSRRSAMRARRGTTPSSSRS
ncbi:Uncharacterised protein [Mycobacteroides abscessus subsp. abscessus]|nr:Uncharacterised protein [Mycobacteroides abscessus subsp. abscessus]